MKRLLFIITCFLVQTSHADELSDAIHANDSVKVSLLLQQSKFSSNDKYKYLDIASEVVHTKRDQMLLLMGVQPVPADLKYFSLALASLLSVTAVDLIPNSYKDTYTKLGFFGFFAFSFLAFKKGANDGLQVYNYVCEEYSNALRMKELIHSVDADKT